MTRRDLFDTMGTGFGMVGLGRTLIAASDLPLAQPAGA